MAAPSNVSAATALALGPLPVSRTQDANDGGTTYTLWYAYTAQPGDGVLGLYAYGDAVAYDVRTKVWTGSPGALVAWLGFNAASPDNAALQMPVVAGATYYFECSSWGGNVSPAILTLILAQAPALAAAVGDLAINAETDGYPLVVLDPATGAVKHFATPFPNGEYGASLPDGTLAIEDKVDGTVSVYAGSGTGALVATVGLASSHPSQPSVVIGSNRATLVYLGASQPASSSRVYTLTRTGTLSGLRWTLPATPLQALAVNATDTVLYYAAYAMAAPIAAYDLVGSAPLPDLAPGLAGYLVMPDLFVLADGSILAAYVRDTTANPSCVVTRYSAAGATLSTYNFNFASTTTVRLACAQDDPASFWLKRHVSGGQVTYLRVRVSDGVTLATVTGAEFNSGVSSYHFPLDGQAHYGNAASCPFWVLESLTPPVPPPTEIRPLRRLRRAPHLSAEQVTQFFARFSLDLEAGVGNAVDPGADPQVYLRWSDDGGHTWRGPLAVSAGQLGSFRRRAIWRRLGRSRDRVFEVSMSDPVKWALLAASLDAGKGTS